MPARLAQFVAAWRRPMVQRMLVLATVIGLILGTETLILHVRVGPLAHAHAYHDTVLPTPRLLVYQASTLVAALREPRRR